MTDRDTQTSRFLSYILRHNPGALGLNLEPGGWVSVETLLERARADGHPISREQLRRIVADGEKNRFTMSDEGTKIRANYGHSIDVSLELSPTPPPERLYHGTPQSAVSSIRSEGLRPQSRQYVHLSSTSEDARSVGRRHGPPVVLVIAAPSLHEAGYTLYEATGAVWLTRRVPPSFIQFPND